ncbi:MAG: DUF1573 domain-containing protein [Prevotella sp.]|nr:DUF1573 domain-containing protein [Prevotella sp.]
MRFFKNKYLLLLLTLSICSCSDDPAQLKLSEDVINIGNVSDDPNLFQYKINLKNIGDQLLLIENIRTSCSCVEGHVENVLLKGGEKTVLTIDVDTKNFDEGEINRELGIYSNSKDSPAILKIVGVMRKK